MGVLLHYAPVTLHDESGMISRKRAGIGVDAHARKPDGTRQPEGNQPGSGCTHLCHWFAYAMSVRRVCENSMHARLWD